MMRIWLLCLLPSVNMLLAAKHNDVTPATEAMEVISRSSGRLALQIFMGLERLEPNKNIVFSPLAIHSILALSAEGAGGQTRQQLRHLLRLAPEHVSLLKTGYRQLLLALQDPSNNITLDLATGLFFSDNYAFRYDWVDTAITCYDALVQRMDFYAHPERSRQDINQWLANRTDQEVTGFMPQGSVNALTLLVMVSAVYFQGEWMHAFDLARTQLLPFNEAVNVAQDMVMMTQTARYRYADLPSRRFKILEIPYFQRQFGMYIIRPDDIAGVDTIANGLNLDILNDVMDDVMLPREVTLTFPQFQVSQRLNLRSVLGHLGLTKLFSPSLSELGLISSGAELFATELAHSVRLEVSERGTKAISGTIQIVALAAEKKIDFIVDRPFIFVVRHNPSRTFLFFGRIIKPPEGDTSIGDFLIRLVNLNRGSSTHIPSVYVWLTCLLSCVVILAAS